jgi:mono/diheme cytochrome c family protein
MASRIGDVRRLLAATLLAGSACSGGGDDPQLSDLANQGRRVYQNVCITCHNGDPTLDGALGPAIAGSSRELLEAKVLRGEYPPGYTPKRAGSVVMPRFEFLSDQIHALAAYLAREAA